MSCLRTEIPKGLNDDLVRKLALLHDAPPGIAESTIALLRFGARTLLAESDPPLIEMSDEKPVQITVTPEGRKVIEACARWVQEAGEQDWTARVPDADSWSNNPDERFRRVLETIEETTDQARTQPETRQPERAC
jgi:hypothetical protein